MKKKITAALLCAVMALSLAGCNGNYEEPDDDDDDDKDDKNKSSYSESVNSPDDSDPDNSKSEDSDPDDSKPEDSKPDDSKPEESKPTESKPEENQPVDTVDWSTVPYADELDFMVDDVEGGVKITQYLGEEKLIMIPQTISGKTVVELSSSGGSLFQSGTIGVNIPNSVTKISRGSFSECNQLNSVVLPDNYDNTSGYDFLDNCPSKNIVYTFLGKTYRFPEDQIKLQDALYPGTGKMLISDKGELVKVSIAIKDVVIPDNVTSIAAGAFTNCDLIENITIPGSVTIVKNETGPIFNNCPNLKSVTFAEGITRIGIYIKDWWSVFKDCPKLETIILPESLTEIRGNAFGGCPALKSITLPDSLKSINDYCFTNHDTDEIPKDLKITYKGVTYKSNQIPNLCKAVNGS